MKCWLSWVSMLLVIAWLVIMYFTVSTLAPSPAPSYYYSRAVRILERYPQAESLVREFAADGQISRSEFLKLGALEENWLRENEAKRLQQLLDAKSASAERDP